MDRAQRLLDDTGVTGDVASTVRSRGHSVKFVRLDSLPLPESVLSAGELEKYTSFKFTKRKREWLGGRTAAKKLIRESILKNHDTDLRNIVISYDKYGRPFCSYLPLHPLLGRPLTFITPISISHCSDYAVAAMCRTAQQLLPGNGGGNHNTIGVDLEKIQKRSHGWVEESFHDCELRPSVPHPPQADYQDLEPEQTTALWTQKEAVLKALGLGLTCSLRDVKIINSVPQFTGKALERWQELKSPRFTIVTRTKPGGYMLSTALGYGRISNLPGEKND